MINYIKKPYIKYKKGVIEGLIVVALIGIILKLFTLLSIYATSESAGKLLIGLGNILSVKISVPIYSLVLSVLLVLIGYIIFQKILIRNNKFKITKATYGIDSRLIDITSELNKKIRGDKLRTILSNEISGDPAVGERKSGKINYTFNGEANSRDYSEGDTIDLPD